MQFEGGYLTHTCGHRVTWIVGAEVWNVPSEFVFEYALKPFGYFPCPWCGGETGTVKIPASETIAVYKNMPSVVSFLAAFKGWSQTHPALAAIHIPNPPPPDVEMDVN